jgi:hypothetical protein
MKRAVRTTTRWRDLFCVQVRHDRGCERSCEDPACSGAEHDLATGEAPRECACERDAAELLRSSRDQYGDLDDLPDPGSAHG